MSSLLNKIRDTKVRNTISFIFIISIFFPFIPSYISTTDTQPTLMIIALIAIYFFVNYPDFYQKYKSQDFTVLIYIFYVIAFSYLSILINTFLMGNGVLPGKYFSFLQFLVAIVFGYSNSFELFDKYANKVFTIYFIFTIIYFLTNGAVENLLILSREYAVGKDLASQGRGSRTLSPEPSFFALQIFNLFLIYSLILVRKGELNLFKNKKIIVIVCFCLLSSLSGYGFMVLFVILSAFFFRYILASVVFVLIFKSYIINYFSEYAYMRAVGLIFKALNNNPLLILSVDRSFVSRFASYQAYVYNFQHHPIIGDGFSLDQGGGFVSILASLGFVGLIVVFYFFIKIFSNVNNRKLIYILFFWFLINFFSGPLGIPPLGIILGLIIRPNFIYKEQLPNA